MQSSHSPLVTNMTEAPLVLFTSSHFGVAQVYCILDGAAYQRHGFHSEQLLNFFMYQEIKATKMSNDNNKINTN